MGQKQLSQISTKKLNEALQTASVKAALNDRAARLLPRAKATAYSAGAREFGDALKIERGTRPGTSAKEGMKRTFARVTVEVTPEMKKADIGRKLSYRQILRRSSYG